MKFFIYSLPLSSKSKSKQIAKFVHFYFYISFSINKLIIVFLKISILLLMSVICCFPLGNVKDWFFHLGDIDLSRLYCVSDCERDFLSDFGLFLDVLSKSLFLRAFSWSCFDLCWFYLEIASK